MEKKSDQVRARRGTGEAAGKEGNGWCMSSEADCPPGRGGGTWMWWCNGILGRFQGLEYLQGCSHVS